MIEFVFMLTHHDQTVDQPLDVLAQVSDSIRDGNGIGEIIFSQSGARRASAARSEDGSAIERGAEVVVIRYDRGVAYVRRWDELSNGLP